MRTGRIDSTQTSWRHPRTREVASSLEYMGGTTPGVSTITENAVAIIQSIEDGATTSEGHGLLDHLGGNPGCAAGNEQT